MNAQERLQQLVEMSRTLARPEWDCVILAEGNTSARVDEGSFWVKASGHHLATAGPEGYVRCAFGPVLDYVRSGAPDDTAVAAALAEAALEPAGLAPSIETVLHGYLLSQPGVNFVAHTHPTAVNAILSSARGEELSQKRISPPEVTFCGRDVCWVPYTDPGAGLARELPRAVEQFRATEGYLPRTIWAQNHGLINWGATADEVLNATLTSVKTARILLGTMALGGPRFLTEAEVDRLAPRREMEGWEE